MGAETDASRRPPVAALGVWLFLAQELMLFGGPLLAYAVYRFRDPAAFAAGSAALDVRLGALNTVVLLASSFAMVLAVRATVAGRPRAAAGALALTAALGLAFLGVKTVEWRHELAPPFEPDLFDALYLVLTGLHGLHMLAGVLVLAGLIVPVLRGRLGPANHGLVEGAGLYWHFVDVVWVFLFPLLYLVA